MGRARRPDSIPVGIGEGGAQGLAQNIRRQGAIPALRLITQVCAPTIPFTGRVNLYTIIRRAHEAR
jgi:hypothetical protein